MALGAGGPVRLQKLLASAGFGSRRDVERFLTEERVTVNGRVATLGDRADPSVDVIRFDGEKLLQERPVYWVVNKPRGVVTTVRDNEGRRTVIDLMPPNVGRVFPVGRLDRETSGLLLMTNDGDLAFTMLHPSLGNEREYRVNVKGKVDARAVTRLERGVNLEEGRMGPAQVSDLRFDPDSGTTSLSLTLIEGKKRQIRRSLLFLGYPVRRLVRVRMGPLRLGRLKVGEARPLRSEEKRELLEHVRRLRAGEPAKVMKPPRPTKATSARGEGARRGSAVRKGPASPPRSKTIRRTRGAAAGEAARPSGSGPRTRKPRTAEKPASARGRAKAGAKGRTPPKGPRGKATGGQTSKATRKTVGSAKRKPTKGATRKPARKSASRKPAKGAAQRTARSRKGTRK